MAEAKGPLGKAAAILMIVWVLLGLLPMFAQMLGAGFVPSVEWVSRTGTLGLVAGLATALLLLWAVQKAPDRETDSSIRKYGAAIGALVLGFLIGRNVVDVSGPMAIALVAGEKTELQFTVESADHTGFKGCHSPVEVEGLPMSFDSACGVPSAFRDDLVPGMRIIMTGRGTSFGIFARYIRRAD